MIRELTAWVLYGLGNAIWTVFEQWLPWGMSGPVYGAYQRLISLSDAVQGEGKGPWDNQP